MKTRKWISTLALMLALVLPAAGLASEDYGAAAEIGRASCRERV